MKKSIREMKSEIETMEMLAIEEVVRIVKRAEKPLTANEISNEVESRTGIEMSAIQIRANLANAGRLADSSTWGKNGKKFASRFQILHNFNMKIEEEEKVRIFAEIDSEGKAIEGGQTIERTTKIKRYSAK